MCFKFCYFFPPKHFSFLLHFSIQIQWVIKVKEMRQNKQRRQIRSGLRRKRKSHKWLYSEVQKKQKCFKGRRGIKMCIDCSWASPRTCCVTYIPRGNIHIILDVLVSPAQTLLAAGILLGAITMRAGNWQLDLAIGKSLVTLISTASL